MSANRFKNAVLAGALLCSAALALAACGAFDPVCNFVSGGAYGQGCPDGFYAASSDLLILWPFTVFALIAYFMRDAVFKAWFYGSVPWVAVSVYLISAADTVPSASALPSLSPAADRFVLLNVLYIAISAAVLIGASLLTRKRKNV